MAEDPVDLFRRTVSQFSSQSSGFDPRQFGMFGWPMMPFPTQGGGGDTPLSPEDGTKRAVVQLYEAIEALDGYSFDGAQNLPQFWQEYLDMFTPGDVPSDSPERVGSLLLGTYLMWLNSLSQLLVESYTVRIINEEVVVDEHRNTLDTQEWLWLLSQSDREEVLLRCTDIEDELVEEMQTARKRRNELLLSFGDWREETLASPVEDGQRYLRVLTRLENHTPTVAGKSLTQYADDPAWMEE